MRHGVRLTEGKTSRRGRGGRAGQEEREIGFSGTRVSFLMNTNFMVFLVCPHQVKKFQVGSVPGIVLTDNNEITE